MGPYLFDRVIMFLQVRVRLRCIELHYGALSIACVSIYSYLSPISPLLRNRPGIHIAMQAGIINPEVDVVIGNSIQSNGEVEWISALDDTPTKPSEGTSMALTGEVWDYLLKHDPESALEYAKRTKVFGRCTPSDKVTIVSTSVEIGDIVLMCGDGGNDCGALKAAHVGIALSDAEASVVAPFTSLDKSILSVTEV